MEEFKQEVIEKEEVKQEVQEQPKKNKKIMYGILAAVVIVAAGIGIFAYNDQQQKQKILDGIQVTFVESPVIEYGEKDFDLNTLIEEKTDEIAKHTEVDTSKLGKQTVVYRVEKEGLTKEFTLEAEVKDTKGPEITFKEDTVTLEYGAEFDVAENIESVKDPVDGDVPYAESAGENNYYIIEGSVDTSTSGEYTITVKAKDKNSIESEKTYTVNVAEEYVEPQAPVSTGNSNSGYTQSNSGGGYSTPNTGGNSGGGSSQAPAPTCDPNAYNEPIEQTLVSKYGLFSDNVSVSQDMREKGETGQPMAVFNQCGDVMGYTKAIKGVDF